MDLGFRGEVADFYEKYRRGYPPAVISSLVDAFGLDEADLVVDLGCGTGQLTIPLAGHVRAVLGVDPEADMLSRARSAAEEQAVTNIGWMVGAASDVPSLRAVLQDRSVGAVTIGQALHWMDHATLFPSLVPLLRPGGGVAVVTNGIPLWLQDAPWSQALHRFLQDWFATTLSRTCGSDPETRRHYRESLARAGFSVTESVVAYSDELTMDEVVGGVYSALSVDRLPAPELRREFADRMAEAIAADAPFVEQVPVRMLTGRKLD